LEKIFQNKYYIKNEYNFQVILFYIVIIFDFISIFLIYKMQNKMIYFILLIVINLITIFIFGFYKNKNQCCKIKINDENVYFYNKNNIVLEKLNNKDILKILRKRIVNTHYYKLGGFTEVKFIIIFKLINNKKINFDNLDFQFENAIKDFAIRNEIDLEWQI